MVLQKRCLLALLCLLAAPLAGSNVAHSMSVPPSTEAPDSKVPVRVEVLAGNLNHPASIAFLPGGGALIAERNGNLQLLGGDGALSPVEGVPSVFHSSQAGLFEVRLHPDFETNRLLFLTYAFGDAKQNGTRLARARLEGTRLLDVTPIYTASPLKRGAVHYGGRMAFLPDGSLILSVGDGFDYRERAQKLDSPLGKLLRIDTNGTAPAGNPFANNEQAQAAIWSIGHRNPQGLAYDPVRRILFEHEHGPRGGDEVNVIRRGENYGWPIATRGLDYSGATISPFRDYPGMQAPLVGWTPSIAPSGLAIYRGAMFPEWEGSLLVGALAGQQVRIVHLSPAGAALSQEALLRSLGARIREVAVAPDGSIWVATDSDTGQILRLVRGE